MGQILKAWWMTSGIIASLVLVAGCPGCPWDDDDDDDDTDASTPTPEPATPTPVVIVPTPEPGPVDLSGDVITVDRDTGEIVDSEVAAELIGAIAVYILRDPDDLTEVVAKSTMDVPGHYSVTLEPNSGDYYILAVVDVDDNRIITSRDLSREAVRSPVTIHTQDVEDVDIIIDLPFSQWIADGGCCSGGSGGAGDGGSSGGGGDGSGGGADDGSIGTTIFTGTVVYDDDDEANTEIAVIAYAPEETDDVYAVKFGWGSGDYELWVPHNGDDVTVLAYADADKNGLFEPNDHAGFAEDNPYLLDGLGYEGVDILIAGVLANGLPQPIPYVSVAGTVAVQQGYNDTPIVVTLSSDVGVLYDEVVLPAPGDFSMRVPGNLTGLSVQAITDSNGNGQLEVGIDGSDHYGPFDLGTSSLGGILLTLNYEEIEPTGFSGVVYYSDSSTITSADRIVVVAFTSTAEEAEPVLVQSVGTTLPIGYEILDLETLLDDRGVDELTLYIGAVLDVGSNLGATGPQADDIVGAYTVEGDTPSGVTLVRGQITGDIDIILGNYWVN